MKEEFLQQARDSVRAAFGGTDSLADLLRIHLVMEQILGEALRLALPSPETLLPQTSLRFFQKARLLRSLNFLTDDALAFLLELNSLRNRFAHRLGYVLTEADAESFGRLCPELYETIKAEDLNTRFSKTISQLLGRLVGQLEGRRILEEGK